MFSPSRKIEMTSKLRQTVSDVLVVSCFFSVLLFSHSSHKRSDDNRNEIGASKIGIMNNSSLIVEMLSRSKSAVVVINKEGVILAWNDASTDLFGWSAGEAVGSNVGILMPAKEKASHDAAILNSSQGEGSHLVECTAIDKHGTRIEIQIHVQSVRTQGGVFFIGFVDRRPA